MMPEPQEKTETREQILEAARERFRQFGYGKTTMAEIAGDCRMSAANLYRFFENKHDIGAALACSCLADDEARLKETLKRPGLNAAQRLEAFILETLHYTYEQWQEQPRIGELVQAVISMRADLVQQHQQAKTRLLAELLRAGNESGEFDVPDPEHIAGTILVAIIALDVPFFLGMYSKDQLETIGHDVAALILKGLLKR
jgi:AcrR family transcriptional regulator